MQGKKHRLWVVVAAVTGLLVLGYATYAAFRVPAGPVPAGRPGAPGAGGGGGGGGGGGAPPGGFALPVETARVAALDVALDATAVGSLRSNESVVLRPETAGRIASINFKDGAPVARGVLLVGLDAATQSAEFDQARANLGLAQANLKRTRELFEKKFISQQALDNAEAALKVQEAAQALAQAKLDRTRIRAPFAGVVGIRNVSVGDYVKEGQELINLEDIATLKVDFRLPEAYLPKLKSGQVLEVASDALPGQQFEAVLEAVNPLVEASGRAVACRARLSNQDGSLRPGMFVRVRLILAERAKVLMVPEQAIVPDLQAPFVFRVVDGKAQRAPVKTGLRRNAQVEILEGLKEDEVIVVAGQMKMREGAPVRSLNEPPPEVPAPAPAPAASTSTASTPTTPPTTPPAAK